MKIIRYGNHEDIDIEFLDDFHYVKKNQAYANFKTGSVKNPYDKSLFGNGFLGDGEYVSRKNDKLEDAYEMWSGVMARCYCYPDRFPAYCGKYIVCDEWHNYQNFAEWYEENKYPVNERLHIDKDILYPNCHIYSPETCILTPQRINMLFSNKPNSRSLPNGIFKIKSGYRAEYQGIKIGRYSTLDEAYDAYSTAKENNIKEVADEYKNIIPKKLYDALYAYKVDINNDKNYKVS